MLTDQLFAVWVARTRLSAAGQAAIAHVRSSEPSRRVGGGRSNVTGRYPSKKMGVTIQFESHRVELPAIFELEHDSSVLEYYDQAPSIKLDYCSADGKRLLSLA
jgi:putative transposase